MVWTNTRGDITVENDVKLLDFRDIQKYAGHQEGPKSRRFCRFHKTATSKVSQDISLASIYNFLEQILDGFDASIFWSSGFLWRNFQTCGVEEWDIEFEEQLPSFKDSRCSYRERKRSLPPLLPPSLPPRAELRRERRRNSPPAERDQKRPRLAPPRHMEEELPRMSPALPTSRVMYINPHHQPPSVETSWTSQVDEFLGKTAPKLAANNNTSKELANGPERHNGVGKRVIVNVAALVASTTSRQVDPGKLLARIHERQESVGERLRMEKERQEELEARGEEGKEKVKYDHEELRTENVELEKEDEPSPEVEEYEGTITEWRSKFGFISCPDFVGKIFLHSKDLLDGRGKMKEGVGVRFEVVHRESSTVGAKAVKVRVKDSPASL